MPCRCTAGSTDSGDSTSVSTSSRCASIQPRESNVCPTTVPVASSATSETRAGPAASTSTRSADLGVVGERACRHRPDGRAVLVAGGTDADHARLAFRNSTVRCHACRAESAS